MDQLVFLTIVVKISWFVIRMAQIGSILFFWQTSISCYESKIALDHVIHAWINMWEGLTRIYYGQPKGEEKTENYCKVNGWKIQKIG